ncbi:unnamed protein product [Pseudo-nitzschia multistriata]|uniref:HSF-type DNA-binding domain-containing protein n=1 Tax=Pseudo-nitzschia multistriata TaxID=183589 RepID=A0A448YWJ2_9STRA|nr:unnamed protein product [Pseudo-nitzschia multistriata]
MKPLAPRRFSSTSGSDAPRQEQMPRNDAIDVGENIERLGHTARSDSDSSVTNTSGVASLLPTPSKNPRLESGILTKRKAATSIDNAGMYPCSNPRGLLLLSFPLKLHLLLQRCESERIIRINNKKRRMGDRRGGRSHGACSGVIVDAGKTTDDDIVVGWLPTGGFKIYDQERFVREIMPSYFFEVGKNKASFETFKRNLELWGFSRVPFVEGPTTRTVHICSHPHFLKGRPSACRNMKFRIEP